MPYISGRFGGASSIDTIAVFRASRDPGIFDKPKSWSNLQQTKPFSTILQELTKFLEVYKSWASPHRVEQFRPIDGCNLLCLLILMQSRFCDPQENLAKWSSRNKLYKKSKANRYFLVHFFFIKNLFKSAVIVFCHLNNKTKRWNNLKYLKYDFTVKLQKIGLGLTQKSTSSSYPFSWKKIREITTILIWMKSEWLRGVPFGSCPRILPSKPPLQLSKILLCLRRINPWALFLISFDFLV